MKIYTDGACTKNGQSNNRGGLGIYCKDYLAESVPIHCTTTNNICELMAIQYAIRWVYELSFYQCVPDVTICTDSVYSMNCLTKWVKTWKQNNWMTSNNKPVKNKELILEISTLLDKLEEKLLVVNFRYVSNNNHKIPPENCEDDDWIGNYRADRLASSALTL